MNIISIIRFFQQVFQSKTIMVKCGNIPQDYQHMVIKLTKTKEGSTGIIQYNDEYGYQWVLDGINNNPEILSREIKKLQEKIDQLNKILSNENFIKNADETVVLEYKEKLKNHGLLMACLKKI